jgi:rhodanese-related sulfurtransferase
MTFASVDELLADARGRLVRLTAAAVAEAVRGGTALVDIRPAWQRIEHGEIPGSLVIERNHLEWRLQPRSAARLPQAVAGQRWIVVCQEGYTSSLAADALNSIGVPATDLEGGFAAWAAAGLPTVPGGTPHDMVVPPDGYTSTMATTKQRQAARKNVKKAQSAARGKRTIAHLPASTRSALGKQGAAVAQRKRTGASTPKTRAELYEIAKRRDLPGRSRMGRDELARALGEK